MRSLFDFDCPDVWTALKERVDPVVLYGMGNGADKVLEQFEKRGIRTAGVMASDDFCRYQDYRGFTVKKESDFIREWGDFTVALCFGSSLPDVMRHIEAVADRHTLLVPNVPVIGDDVMDDAFLEQHRDAIARAYELLADEPSRRVFEGVLHFSYTGRLPYLKAIESEKDEAFQNILCLQNERYLDLGAYRGDTIDEFLRYTDGYEAILAVEPNRKNSRKLTEHLRALSLRNTRVETAAVGEHEDIMRISRKAGRMPTLGDTDGEEIPVRTVDALGFSPTYIKTDIEGMESPMLRGAQQTIRQYKPKINLAAYHRTEAFFSLVLQLHAIRPDYRLYLRKHPYIPCWDLNLYAV